MALVIVDKISPTVARITLNDSDSLNAMSEKMADDFSAAVDSLATESEVLRAIIVTGAGRAFSAGGDLEMLEGKTKLSSDANERKMLEFYGAFLKILDLGVPLIAAINGPAVGAGLCVACACDIRIADERAKLGFTFTRLGLHPGMGATWFLPRVIGESRARELLLTGRIIDAQEALRIGLVSQVMPEGKVIEAAMKVAEEIDSSGPLSIRQVIASLRNRASSLAEALAHEARCQAANYAGEEFKEGVRAAREKRKARF